MPGSHNVPNSRDALLLRRESGTLTWTQPALVLFARTGFGIAVQAALAGAFLLRGVATPWHDAGLWLPVYGTLIDAACLILLWRFTRREGIALFDLVGLERARLLRDVLLGLALIPVSLVFIYFGTSVAGWVVYGQPAPPYFLGNLPFAAALYGVLVWPFLWGLAEQMTYNGYLLPRLQVLCRSTSLAVAVVAFAWSLQHAFMPLMLDPRFMAFRLLSSVPSSIFETLLYLRLRRLIPFVLAHALMDAATVLIPMLRE